MMNVLRDGCSERGTARVGKRHDLKTVRWYVLTLPTTGVARRDKISPAKSLDAELSRRKRQLMSYVQTATDSVGISVHAGSAFPMAVIRLPENEIIWGNPSFFAITGLSDTASYQKLEAVIPDFSNKWLSEGHSEMSGDRNIGDRRYRIYGNFVRSEDSTTTVQLATIYFADMTEMFNIRDEFMRTRPVVSIVLIDNYDELTTNLSDSAISTLDAQLNDVVANWTTGLEALWGYLYVTGQTQRLDELITLAIARTEELWHRQNSK